MYTRCTADFYDWRCTFASLLERFDEVEALLRTAQMELDAARALSKTQADALVDIAESEKAAVRNAQVNEHCLYWDIHVFVLATNLRSSPRCFELSLKRRHKSVSW